MSDWFKDWFASEEYLQVYSHRGNMEAKRLVEFVLSEISIPKNAVVLDAACGAGRHSKIFIEKKYRVFGFDLSKTLLKIANQSANDNAENLHFICADLRKVCFNEKFDLIVNLFTSFGYFNNDAENLQFVKSAFFLLKNNGYYVLDYLNPVFVKNNLIPFSKKIKNDKEIIEEREIVGNRVEKKITIKFNHQIKQFKESVKLYPLSEIESMFENMGFKIYKLFGDYNGSSFNENSSARMLIIFKK